METRWFETPQRIIGMNLWAPEWYNKSIVDFDAESVAEAVAKSGATAGFTFQGFSQDHFGISFFPTRLGKRHANLAPGRDHIGEYAAAMHKRGLKVFGYYCWQDRYLWDRNPDWRQTDAQGNDLLVGHFGDLCPNSPYREHVVERMGELVRLHDLDGVLLDMLEFVTRPYSCYCRYCRRRFRERFGVDIPSGGPDSSAARRRFVSWRYGCIEEVLADIVHSLKDIRPDLVFTHNAFALWSREQWASGAEFEGLFAYDDVVTNIAQWNGWANNEVNRFVDMQWMTGYLTRCFRGLSGKPVWMQMGRFPYDRDYQVQPIHELKLSAYSVIANGGSPVFIDNLFPEGGIDRICFERLGAVFEEVRSKEPYLTIDGELPYAGLLYSRQSNEHADLAFPGETRYQQGFIGAYKALMESHLPFQVFGEGALSAQALSRFRVIVLADAAVLSDKSVSAIAEYVRAGGGVVATAQTSLAARVGETRPNFGLAHVFGADYVNPFNYKVSYIKPSNNPLCRDCDGRDSIPQRGGCPSIVRAHATGDVAAWLQNPSTEVVQEVRVFTYAADVSPGAVTGHPAAIARSHENGRSVYFAGDITRGYGIWGYPTLRSLFVNAVRWCTRDAVPLEIGAPMSVETSCFTRGNGFVVHLLNHASPQFRVHPAMGGTLAEECLPVHEVVVRLALEGRKPARVFSASSGKDLPFTVSGGVMTTTLPVLHEHDMVIVECA